MQGPLSCTFYILLLPKEQYYLPSRAFLETISPLHPPTRPTPCCPKDNPPPPKCSNVVLQWNLSKKTAPLATETLVSRQVVVGDRFNCIEMWVRLICGPPRQVLPHGSGLSRQVPLYYDYTELKQLSTC